MMKLVSLLVVLLSKVHLGIELDLPLLDEAVVVNDIVKGIALVLELFVLSFVSIGNFVGRKLSILVLDLEHHSIFKSHILLLELKLPLLNESVIISNIIIRIVLILKFLILSLISVTNFIRWDLLVLNSGLSLVTNINFGSELDLPLLNKSIIVGNNIIRIVLIFKLFVLSLITVTNLVGWDLLVLVLGVGLSVGLVLQVDV